MPWSTGRSKRSAELPANWPALRAQCKARAGGQCEARLDDHTRCPERGTDAHHHGDRADDTALTWLCSWHHDRETAKQGAAARAVTRAKLTFPRDTLD